MKNSSISIQNTVFTTLTWLKMKTSTSNAHEDQTVFTCWSFHFWGTCKDLHKNAHIEIHTYAQKRFNVSFVSISMSFQREEQHSQSLWREEKLFVELSNILWEVTSK